MTATASRLEVMAARARRAEVRGGLETMRWTNPQRQLLAATDPAVVFWGANQVGKSYVLAADALLFLLGRHPHDQTHRPPVRVYLVGDSWAQMVPTIRKVWELLDKSRVPDRLRLDGGVIKGQKYAVYDILADNGTTSQLIIGTYNEGPRRLAGETLHRIVTDEPMPPSVYGELWPRLVRFGGHLRIGFTPTLSTAEDLGYLWELVDSGHIREIQVPLTLDAVTPRGGLIERPWLSQAEIDAFSAGLLPMERDQRLGLSRYPLATDRVLTGWGEHLIGDAPRSEMVGALVGVGIDHGAKAGRQRAVIIAYKATGTEQRVWVLNEAYSDGRTTPEDDARGVVRALEEVGLSLAEVDVWLGDRAHGGDALGGARDNRMLLNAFSTVTGTARGNLPLKLRRIQTPYKVRGSVWHGCNVVNSLMLNRRLTMSPRCAKLSEDCAEWRGLFTDPAKDGVDALRYIVVAMADRHKAYNMSSQPPTSEATR